MLLTCANPDRRCKQRDVRDTQTIKFEIIFKKTGFRWKDARRWVASSTRSRYVRGTVRDITHFSVTYSQTSIFQINFAFTLATVTISKSQKQKQELLSRDIFKRPSRVCVLPAVLKWQLPTPSSLFPCCKRKDALEFRGNLFCVLQQLWLSACLDGRRI